MAITDRIGAMARRAALTAALLACGPALAGQVAIVEQFDRIDPKRWYIADGWTNGGHQGCHWSAAEVRAADGILRLTLRADAARPSGYACAEIQSREVRHYGLYEVRMRSAAGSGLVSALFTYTGPHFGDPHDEIDIEFLGKAPGLVQLNFYTSGKGDHEQVVELPSPADEGFTVYGFLWAPDRIVWYIDGQPVAEATGPSLPQTPGKAMLSLWNGTDQVRDWLGRFEPPGEAKVMEVDWFAYTPPGERCLLPGSVSCQPEFRW